ncbi:hypothetical protein BT67DRAFT_438090 [Trichocladium antarcticum]|uniref:Uncharacterized protein n=1 Tax=Trichocladium antarcticum TaxID=1450529 RepID=A0AAN6UTM8_9PEZI|nr:hypothetical protein BT67DRAFT_438090 [Trichocladium antarcticum]
MREPPSDQSERDDERCCISSDAKGRTLVTSFPQLIHSVSARPIPERFYRFDEFDSDNTGSAFAQVGRAPSPVPSSQKAENGKWRNWLEQPSSVISSQAAVEGSRVSVDHRVSPGVSEIRRPHQRLPSKEDLAPSADVGVGPEDSDVHQPERNPHQSRPSMEDHVPWTSNGMVPGETRDLSTLLGSSGSSEILSRYEEFLSRLRQFEQFDAPTVRPLTTEHPTEGDAEASMVTQGSEAHEMDMAQVNSADLYKESNVPTEGVETRDHETAASDVQIRHPKSISRDRSSPLSPSAAQQAPTESEGIDSDEAWKAFVFGDEDSDEVGNAVLEEARQDAARKMPPSDSSAAYLRDSPGSEPHSNIATVGTLYANEDGETSDCTETGPPTDASAQATCGRSSIGPGSGPTLNGSGASAEAPSVEVNAGTSTAPGAESNPDSSDDSGPRSVEIVDSSTPGSYTGPPSVPTSMAVVGARSDVGVSEPGTSGEQFRFVPPKLFVGSRSNDMAQFKRGTESGVGISLTRRRRGRPKRRANDGRADIRALPNYSSDPIEEVEDETRPLKSRFPALELA